LFQIAGHCFITFQCLLIVSKEVNAIYPAAMKRFI